MEPRSDEDVLAKAMEDSSEDYHWNFSNSVQHENIVSGSVDSKLKSEKTKTASQSLGVSTSYQKQVSFSESTPFAHCENSTVVLSFDQYDKKCKESNAFFIREKRSWRDTYSYMDSIQKFGEKTLSIAMQRADIFQSVSLPHIPSDDRRSSFTMTVINLMGMSFGISVSALPYVVAKTGLAGIFTIVLLGLLSLYTSLLLVDCQYQDSTSQSKNGKKRVYRNFIDLGTAAIPGKFAGPFIKALVLSSLLSDVYIFLLMGQISVQLTEKIFPSMNYQLWVLVWLALTIPMVGISRVSILAWTSLCSLVSFTLAIGLVYVTFFSLTNKWSIWNIPLDGATGQFFVAFGIVLNSYNIQWYIPAMEGSMKREEDFPKAINVAFSMNILMKLLFAILGAVTFGIATNQSVFENLKLTHSAFTTIVLVVVLLSLYFYFPMGLYVVFEMVDLYFTPYFPLFHGSKIKKVFWLLLSRSLVLMAVVFLAVSFSDFGFVVGVIGSIRGTLVAVLLPCVVHLRLKWKHLGLVKKCFEVSIIVLLLLLGLGGTYFSAMGLVSGVV